MYIFKACNCVSPKRSTIRLPCRYIHVGMWMSLQVHTLVGRLGTISTTGYVGMYISNSSRS